MKIVLVQSKFLVKFCLIFFVTNISNIDRHSSIHQNKASWWIVCVKYLQISQILIITSGENYWILNWFWSSPKQSPHKKGSTDKRGKLNCFMFKVRWCLLDMVCKESWDKAFYFCWRVQMRVRRYAMHVIYSWCCFIENYNNGVSCSLLPQWLLT